MKNILLLNASSVKHQFGVCTAKLAKRESTGKNAV